VSQPRIQIREMREEDLPSVLQIEEKNNPSPWSERSFRSELSNRDAHYFVVECGNEIVGYAGYWAILDEAHITNVSIAPPFQGQGLGRRLVERLLADARDRGITCATLEVRASNRRAQALYERLGFVASGVRKRYYTDSGEDAVVMWLYGLKAEKAG